MYVQNTEKRRSTKWNNSNKEQTIYITKSRRYLKIIKIIRFKSFTKFPLVNLDQIEKRNKFSQNELFIYGSVFGFTIFMLLITILSCIQYDLFSDETFTTVYWPIFRGTFLINMYTWFIALNIYIWDKYNVNYKVSISIFIFFIYPLYLYFY